jgi:hypothetical protein
MVVWRRAQPTPVSTGRSPESPNSPTKPATGTIRAGFLGVDNVGSAMTRTDIATCLAEGLPPEIAEETPLDLFGLIAGL